MSYELYLDRPIQTRNRKTGQFLKGHTPFNKGKKWDDYMSKRSQRKILRKSMKNLQHRATSRPDIAERIGRKVIAILDDGKYLLFDLCRIAAEWCGGERRNVMRCCMNNESTTILRKGKHKDIINNDHRYKGVRFYFADSKVWLNKISTL